MCIRDSCWHLYVLRIVPELLAIDRDQFIIELNERNVGTSVHFIPVHNMSAYKKRFGFADSDFPMAQKHFERLISLPLYPTMTDEQVPVSYTHLGLIPPSSIGLSGQRSCTS